LVDIAAADSMADGWRLWSQWQRSAWPENTGEIAMVEADAGRNLTYIRLVARRREDVKLVDYCWPDTMRSMPQQYEKRAITTE
jgi:hypothetical protein